MCFNLPDQELANRGTSKEWRGEVQVKMGHVICILP